MTLLVVGTACGTSDSGGSSGPGGNGTGTGGSHGGDGGSSSPEDCQYDGMGGGLGWSCDSLTVRLSEPIPSAGLGITITTSLGHTFTEADICPEGAVDPPGCLGVNGDPIQSIALSTNGDAPYDAAWLDVELRQGTTVIGASHFEPLDYACVHAPELASRPCWQATPVTLEVTPGSR